jgi:hypothetical protein
MKEVQTNFTAAAADADATHKKWRVVACLNHWMTGHWHMGCIG